MKELFIAFLVSFCQLGRLPTSKSLIRFTPGVRHNQEVGYSPRLLQAVVPERLRPDSRLAGRLTSSLKICYRKNSAISARLDEGYRLVDLSPTTATSVIKK